MEKNYIDFLKDENFIHWQLIGSEELNCQWKEFMHKNPDSIPEIEKAANILNQDIIRKKILSENDKIELWERIENDIIESKPKSKNVIALIFSAAVMLLMLFGINLYLKKDNKLEERANNNYLLGNLTQTKDIQIIINNQVHKYQKNVTFNCGENHVEILQEDKTLETLRPGKNSYVFQVPYGKRSKAILADGSEVYFNAGTILEIPNGFSKKQRLLKLQSGEVFLNVKKTGIPFSVTTEKFDIKVYGTKFNVSLYDNTPETVTLKEGSISLRTEKSAEEIYIKPNEQARLNSGNFHINKVNADNFITWKDGYLEFNKTPMTEVLKLIGRSYNVSFNLNNRDLEKYTCTGKISLEQNLEEVMTTIGLLTSTKFQIKNNNIYFINEPVKK